MKIKRYSLLVIGPRKLLPEMYDAFNEAGYTEIRHLTDQQRSVLGSFGQKRLPIRVVKNMCDIFCPKIDSDWKGGLPYGVYLQLPLEHQFQFVYELGIRLGALGSGLETDYVNASDLDIFVPDPSSAASYIQVK